MTLVVRPAPSGLACDTYEVLSPAAIAVCKAWGAKGIVRCLDNTTAEELVNIPAAGLWLGFYTSSRAPKWTPSAATGHEDAARVIAFVQKHGLPRGATFWDDLEEPNGLAGPQAMIDHVDACAGDVTAFGCMAGDYIGDSCGLTSEEWYARPNVHRYWASCSVIVDRFGKAVVPYARGWSLLQLRPPNITPAAGVQIDGDAVTLDDRNGPALVYYDEAHAPS